MNAYIDISVNFWFQSVFQNVPSTFCSKSVHAADNILMSWELLAWYSSLHHVSNTLMIITLLKNSKEQELHTFSKNREPHKNYRRYMERTHKF